MNDKQDTPDSTGQEASELSLRESVKRVLDEELAAAEDIATEGELATFVAGDATGLLESAASIASLRYHARGVILTLAACKAADASLSIRLHQAEWKGGFPARSIDTETTAPFLRSHELKAPAVGSSHWLTRRLVDSPFERNVLRTTPKIIGEICPTLVCDLDDEGDSQLARRVVRTILAGMIIERSAEPIDLVRLKNLTIRQVATLLERHFSHKYKGGAPRLPQLAMYALYQCLLPALERYKGHTLGKLQRLKSADAKANTVGDVDVLDDDRPVEGVELKHGIPITMNEVRAAIDKVKARDVKRYYILSTAETKEEERAAVHEACAKFYKSNGCEIIVNGVIDTITYGLRLLDSPDEFISRYADLLHKDEDLSYEHREAWNEISNDIAEGN
jgi:DNA (cytosine-5)-methyltransferase 1